MKALEPHESQPLQRFQITSDQRFLLAACPALQLPLTFTRVVQELHSLYTIGFNPSVLDGKEHKLDVRMKQAGMTARARKSYVASAERLSGAK